MTSKEDIQDLRLDRIEATLQEVVANQRHMQTQMAVMQNTLDRIASDHEKVAVLKEKVDKLEKFVWGALTLASGAIVTEIVFRIFG